MNMKTIFRDIMMVKFIIKMMHVNRIFLKKKKKNKVKIVKIKKTLIKMNIIAMKHF